jgi:hypothetical protein
MLPQIDPKALEFIFQEKYTTIGHLTNYGQNTYFWTFWTFSHRGKSRNDTKPISAGRRDLRVLADLAGCRESKNRKFQLKILLFSRNRILLKIKIKILLIFLFLDARRPAEIG